MAFDFRQGLHAEWEESDGFGGRASGTHSGPNTKRQHALLSFTDSDKAEWVLVNHLEEWLELRGQRLPLSSTVYFDFASAGRMAIHPEGYKHLAEFTPHPFPRWIFEFEGARIIRTIRPVKGSHGFLVEYALVCEEELSARLFIRPMLTGRRASDLHLENRAYRTTLIKTETSALIEPYPGTPSILIGFPAEVEVAYEPQWYRRVRLISSPRDEEALLSPASFTFTLTRESPAWLRFSVGSQHILSAVGDSVRIITESPPPPVLAAALDRAIGYHTIEADAPPAARFLDASAEPAAIPDSIWALGSLVDLLEPDLLSKLLYGYTNTIASAPLDVRLRWLSCLGEAARRGIAHREIAVAGLDLVGEILDGRAADAAPASNMLLLVRADGSSWWERADTIGEKRRGFPVEIQALWANALAGAEILSRTLASNGPIASSAGGAGNGYGYGYGYGTPFHRALDSLRNLYWNSEANCLYDNLLTDAVDPSDVDFALIPRSPRISSAGLLAQALRFDVLPPSRARALLETTKRHLAPPDGDAAVGLKAFADSTLYHPWLVEIWRRAWMNIADDSRSPLAPPFSRVISEAPSDILSIAGLVAAGILEAAPARSTY